jgi:DUF1365 family protein
MPTIKSNTHDIPDKQTLNSRMYYSSIMHHRLKPKAHRFTYRIANLLLDLDELSYLDKYLTGFSYNKAGLFSVYDKDYVTTENHTLKQHVQALLTQQGCTTAKRVELLCIPRNLGYSFNPLCIFFCYDNNNHLYATLYQVSNTFGQKHIYFIEGQNEHRLNHQANKVFFVSPFIDMDCQYQFHINPPDKTLRVLIKQEDSEGPLLNATLIGKSTPLTSKALFTLCLRLPFFTYKVIVGIHWEAFRLWLKKIPLVNRHKIKHPPLMSKGQAMEPASHEE